MKNLSRRSFLKTSAGAAAVTLTAQTPNAANAQTAQDAVSAASAAPKKTKWYKGQLHTHSQWSDGTAMPEAVCAAYKEKGYDFYCLSDHNLFQGEELRFKGMGFGVDPVDLSAFEGETSLWKVFSKNPGWGKVSQDSIDQVKEKFGEDSVKIKTVGDKTYVRMQTFKELADRFNEEEKFLMIPGFEQTGSSADGLAVHMNFINVTSSFGYLRKENPVETVNANAVEGEKIYKDSAEPYLFILNHPQWPYYDVSPEVLRRLNKVRFFELTNNPVTGGPFLEQGWNPEKYWDAVNAYRAANRQPLLYATGSDDAHNINEESTFLGPFWGWNMVRAEALTTNAIMNAMLTGDFYVSTGLCLKDLQFCKETRTLTVAVDGAAPEDVSIEFIGTKKTFDRKVQILETEKPKRKIDIYAEEIGVTLKTEKGLEASYTLQDDDLYVRARVLLKNSSESRPRYQTYVPAAWTQAYTG